MLYNMSVLLHVLTSIVIIVAIVGAYHIGYSEARTKYGRAEGKY